MGDHDRRTAASASSASSSRCRLGPRARVERRERLVEEQRVGSRAERPRQRDPLALAAGERRAAARRPWRHPEAVEQLAGVPLRRSARGTPRMRIGDVPPGAQVAEERVVLEDEAAAPPLGRQLDSGVGVEPGLAVALDPAAPRPDEPGDRPQHGRLARARRPDERQAPAAPTSSSSLELSSSPSAVLELNRSIERSAPPRRDPGPRPMKSMRSSSIAAESATSTAESASAPVKSVPKQLDDRERRGLRHPLERAGEDEGRAELAERPAPGERRAAEEPGLAPPASATLREGPRLAGAERPRGLEQVGSIDANAACAWRT